MEYRVNVYSLAEHEGMVVESEPCHVKVFHILTIIIILYLLPLIILILIIIFLILIILIILKEYMIRHSESMKMQSSLRKVRERLH